MVSFSKQLRLGAVFVAAGVFLVACGDDSSGSGGSSAGDVVLVADWETDSFETETGDAVCSAGEQFELDFGVTDDIEWVDHEFVCADGSGSFVIRAEFDPLTEAQEAGEEGIEVVEGTWTVNGGTSEYSSLSGEGSLRAEFVTGAVVTYEGEMSK